MYFQKKYLKIFFLLVILNEYGIYAVFKLLSLLQNFSDFHVSGRLKFVVSIYAEFQFM